MSTIYTIDTINITTPNILVIGDPHFKLNNIPESKMLLFKTKRLATKIKPTFIVCLGDLLHRHETIHVTPLMLAEDFISALSEIAPTFLIIGNHDRPNNNTFLTNEHPFNALKKWPNVKIIDTVHTETINNYKFTFVPYVSPGRFIEALDTTEGWKDSKIIFAHQEFKGAKMGPITSTMGDNWSSEYPPVISGHIHDYDRFDNIIYVGTPYQHAFGDHDIKTVSLFDIESLKESRVELGLLKRVIYYITPDEIDTFEVPTNKIVKLVIRGSEVQIKNCITSKKITDFRNQGVTVTFKTLITTKPTTTFKKLVPYREKLYTQIQHDPHQTFWFNHLFPQ